MNKNFLILLFFIGNIPGFALSIDKDTVYFVDTSQYAYFHNDSEQQITIDTIKMNYINKNQYIIPNIILYCRMDTGKYIPNVIKSYFFALSVPIDSSFITTNLESKLTVNKNDSLRFYNLEFVLPFSEITYGPGYIIDTFKVCFKASDNTSDTIIAISKYIYASGINNKLVISKINIDNISSSMYLLNGIKLSNTIIGSKYIVNKNINKTSSNKALNLDGKLQRPIRVSTE
jgi:hypothetical protein